MEDHLPRKLAVILHADVVGSTTLVQQNETLAHERIQTSFQRFSETIKIYGGIAHELRGDALVAEFERASDAVAAALSYQAANAEFNSTIDDDIRPQLRIGISLGEVVIADNTITGAGVVLAQRLEQLAESGGVCIQGAAYETVPQRLPFEYTSLGEQRVKGFEESVRAYAVTLKSGEKIPGPEPRATSFEVHPDRVKNPRFAIGAMVLLVIAGVLLALWQPWVTREEPASIEKMAFPLPDKPSIAVLPFTNMSNDAEQEYFADGMTEDLITDLSKVSSLFVIARNSTFTYKGKSVKVRQVAEELGVRYVLEGSVRRVADQVRINAQLIDATTGGHIWAERYDGSLKDVFELQDKVTHNIVTALAVNLTAEEDVRQAYKQTDNPEAYDAFLQGWAHYRQFTRKDFAKALDYFKRAIELDPNYSRAHAAIAGTYTFAMVRGWHYKLSWCDAQSLAEEHLELAMKDPTDLTHRFASVLRSQQGRYEEALAEAEQMIALDPNNAENYDALGYALLWAGSPEDAINAYQKAMRLDPHYPAQYLGRLGIAYFNTGKIEAAAETLARARKRNPGLSAWTLAAAFGHLGREEEAMATLKQYQEYRGWSKLYSVDKVVGWHPYKRRVDSERLGAGLIKAGLCCQDKLESYFANVQVGNINFAQPVDVTKIFENPEGVTVLTEAEIHDKVVGNTIAEVSDGKKWSEYYLTDGTLLGVWGEKRYCDYWVISGPVMCIGSGVFGFCRMYALEGTAITRFKLDGTPKSTGELLQGNAESL